MTNEKTLQQHLKGYTEIGNGRYKMSIYNRRLFVVDQNHCYTVTKVNTNQYTTYFVNDSEVEQVYYKKDLNKIAQSIGYIIRIRIGAYYDK